MANTLVSPGVQVTVVDESQYLPAATNSVPLIVLATASNKLSAAGTGIAPGTLNVNADQLFLATSQRALLAQYGNPFFYTTTNGTPINGYELNEYGLLAAYSALGITNQCYVLRANIDLAALTASLTRPTGNPANNTYWLDTDNTQWGVFQWSQTTGAFTNQLPSVITNTEYVDVDGIPLQSYGSIGQYTVVATNTANPLYFKAGGATTGQTTDTTLLQNYNTWVQVGSTDWQIAWPSVEGTFTPSSITAGDTFTINGSLITVPAAPDNTVTGIVSAITTAAITGVHAANIGGSLYLYNDSTSQGNGSVADGTVVLANGTGTPLTTLGIDVGTYYAPAYQNSPSYTVPQWNTFNAEPAATGSIWQKSNSVNLGTTLVMKQYNSTLGAYVIKSVPVYSSDAAAIYGLDPAYGGETIPAGSLYAKSYPYNNGTAGYMIFERYITGSTVVTGAETSPTFTSGDEFTIGATQPGTANITSVTVTINGTTATSFIEAVSSANIPYVNASIASTGAIVLTHSAGGDIYLTNVGGSTVTADAGFVGQYYQSGSWLGTFLVRNNYVDGSADGVILSNWAGAPTFTYTASGTTPGENPTSGTYWYYSDPTQVDIMIQNNGVWQSYQTVTSDARGYNLTLCNATGPIISATAPTTQTDTAASPLVYGDLWVNTSDLEDYPLLYRWQSVGGVDQWVQIVNSDQTQSSGILFADARWAPNGTTDPVADALPTIESLLTSNYLDQDAPNALLYPTGMLLWNTRRSGFNVKQFELNYFNNQTFPTYDWDSTTTYTIGEYVQDNGAVYACILNGGVGIAPTDTGGSTYWSPQDVINTWVSATGSRPDGSPYMGRQSQRQIIVEALRVAIDTNTQIREEQNNYNLIAVTGYPELAPNMEALNNEINNVAFSIIDTPLRLTPENVANWSSNNNGLGLATADGNLAAGDPYGATFYPSCRTTDLTGNFCVTYPSHMMLRTIIRSDEVAFPWLAPAGTRRGLVDNAQQLGYLNGITGIFETLSVGQSLRDVLYSNQINPITYIPGVGITNFGNKTLQATATALDRINVARLICFIRARLEQIGKQYLFEPNDQITRTEISNSVTSLMLDLVAKRGIYDYLVVCDNSNNTPTTIDQNQLWVDIAIEPVKAVEFIYIPLRIENTGAIAAQAAA
jgi:hypothetical protein